MTRTVTIEDGRGRRSVSADDFPLAVGGPEPDISVPALEAPEVLAYLGLGEDRIFVQPGKGRVVVNGAPLSTSQWLDHGDVLLVGAARIDVASDNGALRLTVRPVEEKKTDPPLVIAEAPRGAPKAPKEIEPVAFEPTPLEELRPRRKRLRPVTVAAWLGLALVAAAFWFVFTARSVRIAVEPAPDRWEVRGGPFTLPLGSRFLLRPGPYTVVAEREGYRRLEESFEVGESSSQSFEFSMRKLPGLLLLETVPAEGAVVRIDGQEIGETPLEPVELSPGEHEVLIRADLHRDFTTRVVIEGEGRKAELRAALEPIWAPVTFRSEPPGATVRIGGKRSGRTPVTVNLVAGNHRYELLLAGRKPYSGRVAVVAGEARTLPAVALTPADGNLQLASVPDGANVTLDGVYQGETPLDIDVTPGVPHEIEVARAGYVPESRTIEIAAGQAESMTVELRVLVGEIEIVADPPDADLYVNGELRGPAARRVIELPAAPHRIEIRKAGYESFATDITPRPGFPQTIEAELLTVEEARALSRPDVVETSEGQELVLISPLRFRMGASRREPGRRANETIREVELTRYYYLSRMEVTNREFREFAPSHRSGAAQGHNLEIDHHPVVRVSWEDAARYCNWLSAKDSLPPAYVEKGGKLVLAAPPTTGYRLPTEAEWVRASRYPAGDALKYPWGQALPAAPGSGNFADQSAEGLVVRTVPNYADGYPATAPAESFGPNALGLFNLGGNVAEWTNDYYAIYPPGTALAKDPLGPDESEFHVIRGSSWMHGSVTQLRLSFRDYGNKPRPDVGFRIARYAE